MPIALRSITRTDPTCAHLLATETFHLSSALGEDWLLEHKNKDVRLLVACALADVLRIFAPEPPYEEETNADVIKLFIKILRGF